MSNWLSYGRYARLDTETCNLTRMGQCSFGPHKPESPGATPGSATCETTRYANRQSGHVESVAILWVRLPLWSLTNTIPWSNGEDAWPTSRKVLVRFQPGSLLTTWSVSVWAARRCGKAEDRVQFPDGPLENTGRWSNGKTLGLHPGNRGSIPRRSTERLKRRGHGPTGRHRYGMAEIGVQFPVTPLTTYGR